MVIFAAWTDLLGMLLDWWQHMAWHALVHDNSWHLRPSARPNSPRAWPCDGRCQRWRLGCPVCFDASGSPLVLCTAMSVWYVEMKRDLQCLLERLLESRFGMFWEDVSWRMFVILPAKCSWSTTLKILRLKTGALHILAPPVLIRFATEVLHSGPYAVVIKRSMCPGVPSTDCHDQSHSKRSIAQ